MAEPFIGRKSAIWLWLESTPGTAVSPIVWIPKTTWVLNPTTEETTDNSGYGVRDEIYDSFITKNYSNLPLEWIVRDEFIGYLLYLGLGNYEKLNVFTGTVTGWTPAKGDTVSGWKLVKVLTIDGTTYYCFDGTVSGATITNGTWTLSATPFTGANFHYFSVKQSQKLPTATVYDDDPVSSSRAPYSMINNLEFSCEVADYLRFSAEFQGMQMQPVEVGTLNPAYSNENPFTASMAGVRFADNESWLNGASEICIQNFRVAINNNLTDVQCFGDTDISAMYATTFGVEGDFETLYGDTTLRDLALASTKQAIRFYAKNGTGADMSGLYIDIMKAGLNEWTKTDNNDDLVSQTMWFTGQYDTENGTAIEVILINDKASY